MDPACGREHSILGLPLSTLFPGIKLRTSSLLGKHCATELYPQPPLVHCLYGRKETRTGGGGLNKPKKGSALALPHQLPQSLSGLMHVPRPRVRHCREPFWCRW